MGPSRLDQNPQHLLAEYTRRVYQSEETHAAINEVLRRDVITQQIAIEKVNRSQQEAHAAHHAQEAGFRQQAQSNIQILLWSRQKLQLL